MANSAKKSIVAGLSDTLSQASHFLLLSHSGMDHKKFEELRKALLKVSTENRIRVAKNSLLQVALDAWSKSKKIADVSFQEMLASALKNQNSLVTLGNDWSKSLAVLKKFGTEIDTVKMKFGFVEGTVFDGVGMQKLATLPSKEVLVGKLLGTMQAPASRTVMSLKYPLTKMVMVLHAKAKQN